MISDIALVIDETDNNVMRVSFVMHWKVVGVVDQNTMDIIRGSRMVLIQ